jgi:LPS sulfotransferase NodH
MIHAGLGAPREYFNPGRISKIAARFGIAGVTNGRQLRTDAAAREAYIATLLEHRAANGIFASIVHWGQYAPFLDNPEGDRLLTQGNFVHLYRQDLLAQAISRNIAWQSGRWGTDGTVTTRPAQNPDYFAPDRIAHHLKVLAEEDMNWRLFFARNAISPLVLSYEGVTTDLAGALHAMVDAFGLDLPTTRFDYVDAWTTAYRDAQVPPWAEIRAHFLRATQRVTQARRANPTPAAS